jgi:16S rRNA (guanine(1405)-N(7))-methyltransferase
MTDERVAEIVADLRETKKYRAVSASVLERTAQWALARYVDREALKAAKRKLHQVYTAYCPPGAIVRLRRLVAALPPSDSPGFRDACREIMRGHTSTAERLGQLDDLYPRLWELTGPPQSVLDLACGFHPFALPWMGLAANVNYVPCDLDERLIEQVNVFLGHLGRPATARCQDVLTDCLEPADVVLILKSLPCLEQQEPGANVRLLRGLQARTAVVSFPTASLGGHRRGMGRHYGKVIESLAVDLGTALQVLESPGEVFAVFDLSTIRCEPSPQGTTS